MVRTPTGLTAVPDPVPLLQRGSGSEDHQLTPKFHCLLQQLHSPVNGGDSRREYAEIQERVVTRAEAWEISSGATFQPEKTAFIRFSQKIEKLDATLRSMIIRGCVVYPSETVEVLGVVLDRQLRSELSSIVHFVQLPPVTHSDIRSINQPTLVTPVRQLRS
jgi:hypothetical protein